MIKCLLIVDIAIALSTSNNASLLSSPQVTISTATPSHISTPTIRAPYSFLLLFFPLFFLLQFRTVVVVDFTGPVSASTAADGSLVSAVASVAVSSSAPSAVVATVVTSAAVGGSVQSSFSALVATVQSVLPSGNSSTSHFSALPKGEYAVSVASRANQNEIVQFVIEL